MKFSLKAFQNEAKIYENRLENPSRILLGFGSVLGGLLVDFGGVFGSLNLQKCVCGVGEVLFCKNSLCFIRFGLGAICVLFLVVLGSILEAKIVPKSVKQSIKKLIDFWIAPGRALGRQK